MNLEQDMEQGYLSQSAFEISADSTIDGDTPFSRFSTKGSSSEFSPMLHDSFMIETFTKSSSFSSDMDGYFVEDSDPFREDSTVFTQPFREGSESETVTNYSNSKMENNQKTCEEQTIQSCKTVPQDGEDMMNKGQRGRPYKFDETVISLANSKFIPLTYRKSIGKAYKTQKPSQWCHICNRSSVRANLMPCFNRWYHRCRKSICQFCIHRYYMQQPAVPPCMFAQDKFFCSHCLGICPTNSQCKTYLRTNLRRHIQSLLEKQQE